MRDLGGVLGGVFDFTSDDDFDSDSGSGSGWIRRLGGVRVFEEGDGDAAQDCSGFVTSTSPEDSSLLERFRNGVDES